MVIGDGKNSGVMMLMMVKMLMINLQVMTNALSRSLVNFARGGRTVESAARKFPVSRCFHLSLLYMFETTIYKLANLLEILNNLNVGFFAQPGAWRPNQTPPVVNKEVLARCKISFCHKTTFLIYFVIIISHMFLFVIFTSSGVC